MGYIGGSGVTVEAVLTKRGRQLLARGNGEFKITHFALADDEISYDLWNSDHPNGTAYYGVVLENMPITEALVDETQMLKHKLVTLPKRTVRIPIINVPQTSVTLNPGQEVTIKPSTVNYTDGNTTFGYTAILSDSDAALIEVVTAASGQIADPSVLPPIITDSEASQAVVVSGKEFKIRAKGTVLAPKSATITFVGNETGGRVVVNLTVKQQNLANTPNIPLTGNPPIKLP
jgi:hypothetical protein